MKNVSRIMICLLFVSIIASFVQAQAIKSVTGNVCSNQYSQNGNGGSIYVRVGKEIIEIYYTLNLSPGELLDLKTKRERDAYTRKHTTQFTPNIANNHNRFFRTGTELIIKYKTDGDWAISIASTGKRKKIKSCSTE